MCVCGVVDRDAKDERTDIYGDRSKCACEHSYKSCGFCARMCGEKINRKKSVIAFVWDYTQYKHI